ncbi:hypothetical protein JRO89_XS12G0102900 [Xanthoceras sorbifolium]|uniref:Pyrrolo-quinoline quinone repeat domain-containing protein n=1 Tax=Xanthoceras sorbifolium TaxID=99658 RepID=A0ABQ8HCB1_9ROSI|nr:hypothetical protein JRO89_XS12G0102900 [Xanthoceras sorbifolium]
MWASSHLLYCRFAAAKSDKDVIPVPALENGNIDVQYQILDDENWLGGIGKRHEARENWLNRGDLYNRRYASKETKISPETVSKLTLKWEFYAGKDISATPAIFNGTLYFPSWNGEIYAVKASDEFLCRGAIWGSSPSIDNRNHVYIATGNTYSIPPHIEECQERENNQTVPTRSDECVEPNNHSNSIVALDLDSGNIKWYHQLGGYDVWFFACNNLSTPGCPPGPNPDADFGEAPMMLSIQVKEIRRDIVAAVQKSGFAWALDRNNGSLFWSTEAGPGSIGGGGTWGAATDGKRIYTNIVNSDGKNFTLKPSNKTTTSGGWVAMDARDGKILWSIAAPSNALAFGPVTFANGVLFAGSTNGKGPIYAINAKTGSVLWSYYTGGTVYGGMSVSNGCIYIGNGYTVNTKQAAQNWPNHGGDLYNRRYANKEKKISPETVSKLHLRWKFYAGGDISVTPAIFNGTVYFPSWNGNLYAVKASDGSLVWKKNLQKLTGFNNTGFVLNVNSTVSRSTPTIAGDLLLVGLFGPAVVIAVKRSNGNLVWSTRLDHDHARSFITMSGTYYKGTFYVGTSSIEEGLSVELCCTFRGSLAKLDAKTGRVLWQTFMLPDNFGKTGEYSGAAIWGSSPSIDPVRNHVYIATGNLYSAPLHVRQCQEEENNQTTPTSPDKCIEPENHSNSILALDINTGKIKWYKQLGGYDVWFGACNWHLNPNCPPGPSPDADFAEAPMMLSIYVNRVKHDIVVAVQKSGFAWALDRDNGSLVWSMEAGPGGLGGGAMWGSATDERRIYTNIANSQHKNFTLKPFKNTTIAGGWVAMDARNGNVLWSTANPSNATAPGPVTVANGVLFAGSTYRQGPVYALNAKTGKILWSYDTGATIYGGGSVSNGCIYMGNGYKVTVGFVNPNFTSGTSVFAFCVS